MLHRTLFVTAAFSAALVVACGAASPPPAGQGETPASGVTAMNGDSAAGHTLLAGVPLTLRLSADDDVLAVVADLGEGGAPDRALRLTLEGLAGGEPPATVRVFVNSSEANLATPLDQAGYVGDLGFFPAGGQGAADSFLLDLGQTLAALPPERRLVDGRFIDVTLIAVPAIEAAGAGVQQPGEMRLERVRVSVHPVPDEG